MHNPIGSSDEDQHNDLKFGKSCERGRETERHDLGKMLCLSLKQAFEVSGSPFHLRLRLFLDGCCMDLDESRAQSLENKSPDRTVILLSISDDFQQHLGSTFSSVIAFNVVLTSEDNVCKRDLSPPFHGFMSILSENYISVSSKLFILHKCIRSW